MKLDLKQIIPNENFTNDAREWLETIKAEHGRLQRILKKHTEGRIREATDRNGFSRQLKPASMRWKHFLQNFAAATS